MRVYLTSPWIPAEWVRAHGLEARGIWFADKFRQDTPPLAGGVCAFAESVVRLAEAQPDSAVVFTTACDQLRRGFDAATVCEPTRAFLFNLPATQTPAARQIFRAELARLGQFLVTLGGTAPTPEILRHEMAQSDEVRRRLRAAAPPAAARSYAESVARFHTDGSFAAPTVLDPSPAAPLALVGGPLGAKDWKLFDTMEAAGGRVVLNGTLTGERSLCPTFDGNAGWPPDSAAADHQSVGKPKPFDALAAGYIDNLVDVFQRPNTRFYAWLKPRLLDRHVRGIVLWHFTGCDLWRAEWQTLREVSGLPVLLLEADEAAGVSPRDANRLQAFVEMLTPA